MPLYEYLCKKCGHRFEKIRKFSDRPIKKCPECGGPVEQVITAPAVQFKGSGWYVTDYAKKSSAPSSSSSESGSKDSKDSKDSRNSDSKDSKDSKESKESKKDDKKAESSTKDTSSKKADKQK